MTPVIEVNHISKCFPARRGPRDLRGRGGVRDWLLGRKQEIFTALRDINFSVNPGESLGIIGRNGSGKSTLLSILAGVTLPTTGDVTVHGRVASLLELGAGFHPILTGRENVYLNAGLLGMRHAQTNAVFDEIVRFAGIGEFIDQPVETYSSGMFVRLGFSVAVHANPDIFLVDEVLSVGDEEFQRKCRHKIGELREQGKTLVFVSHDLGIVNTLCERVILLSQGRMVQRETAQKTISFYLRQVGAEKGIHLFSKDEEEGIHCEGRISLYHKKEEISAPNGLIMTLTSLGQYHTSSNAEWVMESTHEQGGTARGRMTRLPASLVWTMAFDETGRFCWDVALDCERELALNYIDIQVALPTTYTRWLYGDFSGTFPEIQPSDTRWAIVISPEMRALEAAALPDPESSLPPLVVRVRADHPNFGLAWHNSEYLSHSRVLCVSGSFPEHANRFAPGLHPLARIILDAGLDAGKVEETVRSGRVVQSGGLTARFEHGCLRLFKDGVEATSYLNVYASLLIEHLWNDSHSLQWGSVHEVENGISLTGESRRFPFKQRWEVTSAEGGVDLRIWLETFENLSVQEYHTSVVLQAGYTHWRTDHEEGAYPPFERDGRMWRHVNHSYAAGKVISASGAGLPGIALTALPDCPTVRMTPINTTFQENARVMQALRPSEDGRLMFAPGRHLYFAGRITLSSIETPGCGDGAGNGPAQPLL